MAMLASAGILNRAGCHAIANTLRQRRNCAATGFLPPWWQSRRRDLARMKGTWTDA